MLMAARIKPREIEQEILRATNFERESLGFEPLKYDSGLADLARYHSANMARHDFFAHEDHEGKTVGSRAQARYSQLLYVSIGENLASLTNATDSKMVVTEAISGWMDSPGHRENILNSRFTHLGVGVIVEGRKVLITQVFAYPMVKLISKIPNTVDKDRELVLYCEYMRDGGAERYEGYLHYPDRNQKHFIDERTYVVGFEPVPLKWTGKRAFSVRLQFRGGPGTYVLTFGEGGTFINNGFAIQVR